MREKKYKVGKKKKGSDRVYVYILFRSVIDAKAVIKR